MNLKKRLTDPRNRLDVVAGVVDGILNGLTLAAGKLFNGGGASLSLVLKVGAATGFTTLFVFFLAHYAQGRTDLVRAERELNLLSHGRLATTQLGKQVLIESFSGALIAAICGLFGAFAPLLLAMIMPPIVGVGISILALGILGAVLARTFYASPFVWGGIVMIGGVILTVIGVQLNIVG